MDFHELALEATARGSGLHQEIRPEKSNGDTLRMQGVAAKNVRADQAVAVPVPRQVGQAGGAC
jgi:hypothetical protein